MEENWLESLPFPETSSPGDVYGEIRNHSLNLVAGIDLCSGDELFREININEALQVMSEHVDRLIQDASIRTQLKTLLDEFVFNIVGYLHSKGELNLFNLARIIIGLFYGNIGEFDGDDDYIAKNTLVRTGNPVDDEARDRYFLINKDCNRDGLRPEKPSDTHNVPAEFIALYRAISNIRSKIGECRALRIPVEDFRLLIPEALFLDKDLETAFVKVFFSDNAWSLYVREYDRDVDVNDNI
jgi:hypothetical protein